MAGVGATFVVGAFAADFAATVVFAFGSTTLAAIVFFAGAFVAACSTGAFVAAWFVVVFVDFIGNPI
ncbi:hypothetical protein F6X37_24095 [Paraburkholderia sp. 31.1]|nr:hypothetical protein [Paraburkholderia sp. 31.1]